MLWVERGVEDVKTPEGTGFGTTLIEQTLRARGGGVTTSYNAGGITSEISLPLPDAAQTARGMRAGETDKGARPTPFHRDGLKGRRILIVEDEPLIAMDIASGLKTAGCLIVGPAATLDSARRLIAEVDFDAALIDGNLGGQPVDELALALTQKNVPFVFVTGYGRDSLPHGFREALVLCKPFEPKELRATLEAVLREGHGVTKLRRPNLA
jgi:CheY-like chemotaxis protein